MKMRANPEMLAFLTGFDTTDGKWSHEKARKALGKTKCAASAKAKPRPSPLSTPASKPKSKPNTNPAATPPDLSGNDNAPPRSQKAPKTSSVSNKEQRLSPSRTFTIASQGRLSNMQDFRKAFTSFENSGAGDCLFESFRQSLQLTDSVLEMRSNMVTRLLHAPDDATRVSQLNEHIMREIDVRNEDYMGWGADGNEGMNERTARILITSPHFQRLWDQYTDDMQYNAAYAGGAEAAALADMYGVNVSVWTHNRRNNTATHLTTHLQSPPAPQTVHLLSIGNNHYEATNLPAPAYPILVDPSSQSQIRTRGAQQPPLSNLQPQLQPAVAHNKDPPPAAPSLPPQTPTLLCPELLPQPPVKRSWNTVSAPQVHHSACSYPTPAPYLPIINSHLSQPPIQSDSQDSHTTKRASPPQVRTSVCTTKQLKCFYFSQLYHDTHIL